MEMERVRTSNTRSATQGNLIAEAITTYLPDILRILSSLQTAFADEKSNSLKTLADRIQKLHRWLSQATDEVKTDTHALLDQVGAFAVALQSFFDHGANKYIPDFRAELNVMNQKLDTVVKRNPRRDTSTILDELHQAYDSARSMFYRLMVGIQAAQTENAWLFVGYVSSSTTAAIGGAIAAGAGGIAMAVSAVGAPRSVVRCVAVGLAICGYVQMKRNENELVRQAKLKAIDLRHTVCKIKRSAQRLLFEMNIERMDLCKRLIKDLEALEKLIMVGVVD